MTQPAFVIRTTPNGIRVLIIKEEHISNIGLPEYDKFDAMLFKSRVEHIVRHQYMVFNPVMEPSCFYKPIFFNPAIHDIETKHLCDDFAEKFSDPIIENKSIEIINHTKSLNFEIVPKELEPGEGPIIISLFRYLLSRSEIFPNLIFLPGSPWGYTLPVFSFFVTNNYIRIESVATMMRKFNRVYNFMQSLELIDIVHVCPKCHRSHLIFTEVCPKCNKPNIVEEDVIHHFPCANISSEATYLKGDKLICPKCKKELRHIGMDYDRPMGVYTCESCNISFSQPAMRVTCVSCSNVTTPDNLVEVRISKLKFTPLGIRAFASNDNPTLKEIYNEVKEIEQKEDKFYEEQ